MGGIWGEELFTDKVPMQREGSMLVEFYPSRQCCAAVLIWQGACCSSLCLRASVGSKWTTPQI